MIILKESTGKTILSESIDLFQHKEYSEMGKDIWIPSQQTSAPKLRLRITYNYSDI